ncbi:MAG TPA: hypothetical protein VFX89_10220 [Gammaproteobacteria bacterium]|nr:hypothetical protein [Gammaproteobacteria bacterium]
MSAIARVLWTFGAAVPIQRWLGATALVLGGLALGTLALGLRWEPVWALSLISLLMYVLATMFAAGYLLRVLSAPRTHRFLPYFRARTLAAFLLIVLAVSLPGLTFLASPARPGAGLIAAPFFFMSFVLFLVFAPAPSIVAGTLVSAAMALVARSEKADALFAGLGIHPAIAVVAVWAAWWAAFAVWYLRTPAIHPYQWPPKVLTSWAESQWSAESAGEFTRSTAIATSLTTAFALGARRRAVLVLPSVALLAVLTVLLRRPGTPFALGFLLGLALMPVFSGPFASRLARRARLLWLASGQSRRELFATTERTFWLRHVPGLVVVVLCAAVWLALAYDVKAALLGRILLLWATGMPFGIYLGLAAVRGNLLEYVPAGVFVVSVAVGAWAALSEPPRLEWLAAVGAFQVAAAAGLRAFAILRWRQIDWLAFRPLRSPSQGVRGLQ